MQPDIPTPQLLQEYLAYIARLETAVGMPRYKRYSEEECKRLNIVAYWLTQLAKRELSR